MDSQKELLYEYTGSLVQLVEYGVSAEALFGGEIPPPPEGVRLDAHFEAKVTGKITGTVKGVDYLHVRADGRDQLHIHAEITTDDGKKIALAADGVAIPQPGSPVFELRENVTLFTNHAELKDLNTIQVWATGAVDVAKGELHVKGYIA